MTPTLPVLDVGLAPYAELQAVQARLRRHVAAGGAPGVLLLLEHPAVITLGSRGRQADVPFLDARGTAAVRGGTIVPVTRSERGGAATLHAPGQLVSYPVLPIPGRDLRSYVHALEEVLVRLLLGYGIRAVRRPEAPGLYVRTAGGADEEPSKIASIGLRCERWVASHGTSLNVSVDLSLFDLIVSCGEVGLRQTSIEVLVDATVVMTDIKNAYVSAFAEVFRTPVAPISRVSVGEIERVVGAAPPTT